MTASYSPLLCGIFFSAQKNGRADPKSLFNAALVLLLLLSNDISLAFLCTTEHLYTPCQCFSVYLAGHYFAIYFVVLVDQKVILRPLCTIGTCSKKSHSHSQSCQLYRTSASLSSFLIDRNHRKTLYSTCTVLLSSKTEVLSNDCEASNNNLWIWMLHITEERGNKNKSHRNKYFNVNARCDQIRQN